MSYLGDFLTINFLLPCAQAKQYSTNECDRCFYLNSSPLKSNRIGE